MTFRLISISIFLASLLQGCGSMPLPVDVSQYRFKSAPQPIQKEIISQASEPKEPTQELQQEQRQEVKITVLAPEGRKSVEAKLEFKHQDEGNQDSQTSANTDESKPASKNIESKISDNKIANASKRNRNRVDGPSSKSLIRKKPLRLSRADTKAVLGPEFSPPPILYAERSLKQYIKRAVKSLNAGRVNRARLELNSALDKKPGYPDAVLLIQQLDQSPEEFLGENRYFNYELQSQETLMTVSERFLGTPLKFLALAKLNQMDVTGKVKAGTIIKVPGVRPEELSKKPQDRNSRLERHSVAASDKDLDKKLLDSKRMINEGRYLSSIELLNSIKVSSTTPLTLGVRKLLDQAYVEYTNELMGRSSLLEAQALLESAISEYPKSKRIKKQLRLVKSRREAERLFKIGISELSAGNQAEAFEVFSKTIELNPKHMLAKKKITSLKSDVVGVYHKRAMQHYMKQELEDAIKVWNRLLNIEPGHSLARVYLQKARKLQQRFDQL